MDNITIVTIVTLIGALAGTLIPYIIKVRQDPGLSFDLNYAYTLLIGVILQLAGLIPDSVPTISIKIMITAFAAGYGIQSLLNKAIPIKN